jgi:tryptophanyl-tRNA synthetase
MRILSGIQPSGALHLGNYFGMMKPAIELQFE